jgi:hypothetical protein
MVIYCRHKLGYNPINVVLYPFISSTALPSMSLLWQTGGPCKNMAKESLSSHSTQVCQASNGEKTVQFEYPAKIK